MKTLRNFVNESIGSSTIANLMKSRDPFTVKEIKTWAQWDDKHGVALDKLSDDQLDVSKFPVTDNIIALHVIKMDALNRLGMNDRQSAEMIFVKGSVMIAKVGITDQRSHGYHLIALNKAFGNKNDAKDAYDLVNKILRPINTGDISVITYVPHSLATRAATSKDKPKTSDGDVTRQLRNAIMQNKYDTAEKLHESIKSDLLKYVNGLDANHIRISTYKYGTAMHSITIHYEGSGNGYIKIEIKPDGSATYDYSNMRSPEALAMAIQFTDVFVRIAKKELPNAVKIQEDYTKRYDALTKRLQLKKL